MKTFELTGQPEVEEADLKLFKVELPDKSNAFCLSIDGRSVLIRTRTEEIIRL